MSLPKKTSRVVPISMNVVLLSLREGGGGGILQLGKLYPETVIAISVQNSFAHALYS